MSLDQLKADLRKGKIFSFVSKWRLELISAIVATLAYLIVKGVFGLHYKAAAPEKAEQLLTLMQIRQTAAHIDEALHGKSSVKVHGQSQFAPHFIGVEPGQGFRKPSTNKIDLYIQRKSIKVF